MSKYTDTLYAWRPEEYAADAEIRRRRREEVVGAVLGVPLAVALFALLLAL